MSIEVKWRVQLGDKAPSVLEVTSSGLTHTTGKVPPNKHRLYKPTLKPHYGFMEIDWGKSLTFFIKGKSGEIYQEHQIEL